MTDQICVDDKTLTSRDPHLDTMKAILITLVVFGHCISNLFAVHSQWIFILIYSFHMPAWFMSSGIVFNSSYSFGEFVKKKAKGLLYPIIGFVVLLEVYYLGMNFLQHNFPEYLIEHYSFNAILRNILFLPNGSWGGLWYLPALFVLCIIGFIINKVSQIVIKWFCVGLCAIIGFIMINYGVQVPFYAEISLIALPFFYLGKPIYNWVRKQNIVRAKIYYVLLSAVWFVMTVVYLCNNHIVFEMASGNVGNPFLFYITATLGSTSIMLLSQFIKSMPLIQLIGRETLFIYGFHYPVVALARFVIRRVISTQNLIVSTLISLLVAIIIIAFLVLVKITFRYIISRKVKVNQSLVSDPLKNN